jgi:pimeloyl-ACP methyl ester carboxylesterase
LVRDNVEVFAALPAGIHAAVVRAYIAGASHGGLTSGQVDMLADPWLDSTGQAAFYRQVAQADQVFTDEIEPLYPSLDLPVLVVWGENDTWIPLDRAHRLVHLIPRARLETIAAAGHLIHLDAPVQLATALNRWLSPWTV